MEIVDVRQIIRRICVVGAGTMGRRIALQCAVHGFEVSLWSRTAATLQEAREWQTKALYKRVKKGMFLEENIDKVLSRIDYTTDLTEAAKNADFIFEATSEDLEVKRKIFAQLDEICPEHAILSTNSSSIRSSLIADVTKRPDKVLNAHFALRIEDNCLLELMGNQWTSERTMELAAALGQSIKWL